MLTNGRCKAVESLTADDTLMGDDGTPRRILPSSLRWGPDGRRLPTGHGRLYTITCAVDGAGRVPFTVNEEHILVLSLKGRLWQPELREFLAASPAVQQSALMFQSAALPFTGHNGGLTAVVEAALSRPVTSVETAQWAWLIGAWLVCGAEDDATGAGGYALLLPCDRSSNRVRQSHAPMVERVQAWRVSLPSASASPLSVGDAAQLHTRCDRTSSSQWRVPLGDRNGLFATVLRRLSLAPPSRGSGGVRRLPWCLLTETISIRSALLAGLVDGGGERAADSRSLLLSSPCKQFLQQVAQLCRGLGLCAADIDIATAEGAESSRCTLPVSGPELCTLPLALEWKRPAPSCGGDQQSGSSRLFPFIVKACGVGDYFGFEVDGNRRFLLSDHTVTHNTSTIAAIVRTLVCDPQCRVLCVARTNTAARHMAAACSKFLGPQKLTLQVSTGQKTNTNSARGTLARPRTGEGGRQCSSTLIITCFCCFRSHARVCVFV